MDIKELKEKIEKKSLDDSMLILKYDGNAFIADQYIDAISGFKNLTKAYISEFSEIPNESESLFGDDINNTLYILNVETLVNFRVIDNCIIKCKAIDVENPDVQNYCVELPKLKEWQIQDYIQSLLPGLKKEEQEWLCSICNYDIYRLSNEASKLSIFDKGSQETIFHQMNEEDAYSDLSPLSIFDFTNAILKKDLRIISSVLKDFKSIDIEPMGVVTILKKNIFNIISIQLNPKATPDSLNMPPKQFNAIKYNCGRFSNKKLISIFEMLTSIDYKLKSGELPNDLIIDYILVNILE